MKTQTIIGLTGHYNWLRRRVWFWQRKAYERDGWYKSPAEGHLRPMMVMRVDSTLLQWRKNQSINATLRCVCEQQ